MKLLFVHYGLTFLSDFLRSLLCFEIISYMHSLSAEAILLFFFFGDFGYKGSPNLIGSFMFVANGKAIVSWLSETPESPLGWARCSVYPPLRCLPYVKSNKELKLGFVFGSWCRTPMMKLVQIKRQKYCWNLCYITETILLVNVVIPMHSWSFLPRSVIMFTRRI